MSEDRLASRSSWSRMVDPRDNAITHHYVDTNGITLHAAELGNGPAVLFCHGFPGTWRGWRRQMNALSGGGYRVVAADMRGYGASSIPGDAALYTPFYTVGDLVGLLDALHIETATIVGHDFGAVTAWMAVLMRPDRFTAVFCLSVPFQPRGRESLLDRFRSMGQTDLYIFRHLRPEAEADWADAAITIPGALYWASGSPGPEERWSPLDPRRRLERPAPVRCPDWADAEDVAAEIADFQRNGFHGPLNYYRAIQPFFDQSAAFSGARIAQPSFFLTGSVDGAKEMRTVSESGLHPWLLDLRGYVELEGIGHWPQLEASKAVSAALLSFLAGLPAR